MKTRIQTSVERLQKHSVARTFKTSVPAMMLIAVALVCFELLPTAYAVRPTPSPSPTPSPTATPVPTPTGEDRGNGNSAAESVDAMNISTTGLYNTAHGWHSLSVNTDGSENTATGYAALLSNTSGNANNAFGTYSLQLNTTGNDNNAFGDGALYSNTTGEDNTAVGDLALQSNSTGRGNVAIGAQALARSTAVGYDNYGASVAIGYRALTNVTGYGWGSGNGNVAIGDRALEHQTTYGYNVAVGLLALNDLTGGEWNLAIGSEAGTGLTFGSGNVYIGPLQRGSGVEWNHTYIANIKETSVSGGGTDTVTVNLQTGLIGHLSSSRRHKEDIKVMDNASETLYRLKPVTYRYKKEIDQSQSLDYGLIAEDVASVDPNLAIRNGQGEIESVRYTAINIMLLNEFLKEHKAFVEEQGKVKKLEAGLAVLLTTVKEQAAQIEKVRVHLQIRKPMQSLARNIP